MSFVLVGAHTQSDHGWPSSFFLCGNSRGGRVDGSYVSHIELLAVAREWSVLRGEKLDRKEMEVYSRIPVSLVFGLKKSRTEIADRRPPFLVFF